MTNFSLFIRAKTNANDPNLDGVAVSSTNTYYSKVISGSHSTSKAAHFYWTGTPTGTLTKWLSDKEAPILTTDADWVQDTNFAVTNPAGSASQFREEKTGVSARWIRYRYINASGSGVLYGRATSQGA